MDEHLRCAVCFSDYDTDSHKPCMGKCGHSICLTCSVNVRYDPCPVCKRDDAFDEIVVNLGLLYIIDNITKTKKVEQKKEVEGICSLCKNEATKLAICIDCSLENGIFMIDDLESKNEDEIGVKWNTENRSLAECIKQAELSSFCADCSIQTVHSRHQIQLFLDVQKKIFSKEMSGIKEEFERFLSSYDNQKERVIYKLGEHRKNILKLLDTICQLTFDQFTNYPNEVVDFIITSNVISTGLTNFHRNITCSKNNFDKKLLNNAQWHDKSVKDNKIYHLKNNENKLQIYAYSTILNVMQMTTEISIPSHSSSFFYEDNIYIIGGKVGRDSLKTVEVYNLNDKTRIKLADLNEDHWSPSICMHNGKIVVCGGINNSIVEEYDLNKNEWKIIGTSNVDFCNSMIVSLENDLYVIGKDPNDYIIIEKYNKVKSTFEKVFRGHIIRSVSLQNCTSFNGNIFIVVTSSDSTPFCVWNYKISTRKFKETQLITREGWDVKLYQFNNQLYAIDSEYVEVFDEKNYEWNFICRRNQ